MGYLVTVLVWALFVAVTLRPPFRRGTAGFVVFVMAMTMNEVPLVMMVVFLVSVGLLLPEMSADIPGAAGHLVALLVVAGLVRLHLRALTARPALEVALNRELGGEWRSRIHPTLSVPARSIHWWEGVLRPFQRRAPGVRRVRNLRYGPDRRYHRLDLYDRPGTLAPLGRPVLIHLHGGGFVQGGKSREALALVNQLAEHGWLVVTANYRLRRAAQFPNPLVDTKRVVAWARAQASSHTVNPDEIFLAGASAGGHLAVSAALTPNQERFQPGFETADTSVAGVVCFYPYLGPRNADPASSPAALAADAPPLLVVHGSNDTAIPSSAVRSVVETLRRASRQPVVCAELPGAQHDFDFFASLRARSVADAAEAFLAWIRSSRTGSPAGTPACGSSD